MTAITVTDLTSGEVAGNGVFDQLMRATKAHLTEEYSLNHIRGTDFATVYLGAMQSVMTQSLQFLLQQQQVDLQAQLLEKQIISEQKGQDLLDQQILNAVTENTVLVAQECKLRAEFDVLQEQVLKTISETALLNQKKVTEQAQTTGIGVDVDSVVGRQKALYVAQTDGFARDAEQKTAKLMADVWSVQRTTDEAIQANATNGLDDAAIGRAINKLLTGVNA